MRQIFLVLLYGASMAFAYGQHARNTLVASVSSADRMSVVRNSIDLAAWHETSFWPLYDNYMKKLERVSSSTYETLRDLTQINQNANIDDARHIAMRLISNRSEELSLKKQYYKEIGDALNGRVALQFLQTEALLDMMQSTRIYEQSTWKRYLLHPKTTQAENGREIKLQTLQSAFLLNEERFEIFRRLFIHYEDERDALLGEGHSIISLYAGEAADYTPALAKRLGNDFLSLLEREIKLEERYFNDVNNALGGVVAARALAFEDYHSLLNKMYAWAEMP